MGRSQVQYNKTHGRGRGRGRTTNNNTNNANNNQSNENNTKQKREYKGKNKVNITTSNAWRYEEELDDSNEYITENNSVQKRVDLSSRLHTNEFGNDDDNDDIILESTVINDILHIDETMLRDAFLKIPVKTRLYLPLNDIALELEREELGDNYEDSEIAKDFNDKVNIAQKNDGRTRDEGAASKTKQEKNLNNDEIDKTKHKENLNKGTTSEGSSEEDDLDVWLDDAITQGNEDNDTSNNDDTNINTNENQTVTSEENNSTQEDEEDDLDAWLDDVIS